jgi:hypothetical protein
MTSVQMLPTFSSNYFLASSDLDDDVDTAQVSKTLVFNPPLIELIVPKKFRNNIAVTVTTIISIYCD